MYTSPSSQLFAPLDNPVGRVVSREEFGAIDTLLNYSFLAFVLAGVFLGTGSSLF